MDLEPVVDHDDLVNDEAEDGLFEFEVGISEPIAKLYRDLAGSLGMSDGEISSGLPRAQFGLLVFYSQDPVLERLLAGLEVGQIERSGLVRVDQPFALPAQFSQPSRGQLLELAVLGIGRRLVQPVGDLLRQGVAICSCS